LWGGGERDPKEKGGATGEVSGLKRGSGGELKFHRSVGFFKLEGHTEGKITTNERRKRGGRYCNKENDWTMNKKRVRNRKIKKTEESKVNYCCGNPGGILKTEQIPP